MSYVNPKLGMTSNYLVWGLDGESDCQAGMKQTMPAQYVLYISLSYYLVEGYNTSLVHLNWRSI